MPNSEAPEVAVSWWRRWNIRTRAIDAFKTGFAAVLCLWLGQIFRLEHGYWAAVTAIVVMGSDAVITFTTSRDRLIGTAIGAFLGWVTWYLWHGHYLIYGLAVMLCVFVCSALAFEKAGRLAAVTLPSSASTADPPRPRSRDFLRSAWESLSPSPSHCPVFPPPTKTETAKTKGSCFVPPPDMFSVNRMCYDPGHVHSLVQQDLGKYLSKGTFPLMSTQTVALWKRLVTSLEKDCKATVKAMKLLRGYEDSYSPKISFGTKDFETGFGPEKIFVCYAHQRLCKGFALAEKDPWQKLIQRLRAVIVSENFLDASDVHLLMSPYTNMGGGLNPSPVSLIPDASLGVTFGSVPDQNVIAGKADCWRQVKKRCYESAGGQASFPADYWQPPLAWLGKKPHYVLAHLLNHNLNGPGGNELNVVPFWATANTQMSNKIEKFVKDLVSFGVVVTYSITAGDPMKLDPTYATWAKTASGTADQNKILKGEQELPHYLTFNATAKDSLGNTVNVVPPGTRIDNFVPMTVPTIY